jgi:hypothetical protein
VFYLFYLRFLLFKIRVIRAIRRSEKFVRLVSLVCSGSLRFALISVHWRFTLFAILQSVFICVHLWFRKIRAISAISVAVVPLLFFSSSAQDVLAPPPPEFSTQPPPNFVNGLPVETNSAEAAIPGTYTSMASQPSTLNPGPRLFDLGPVQLRPHLFYQFSYGNGIQPQPGHQTATAVNELASGMLVDIGPHWHLDYTPTMRFYSSKEFRDGTDHAVSLTWGTGFSAWVLGLSQSYLFSTQPLVETGSQTETETYSTTLNAVCQLNSKVSIDFAVNQNFRFVNSVTTNQPLSDSRSWSTTEGMNYQIWPSLSAGLSVTFDYDDMTVGPNMTSEQVQGRLNWQPGSKLTFFLSGGFEDRQFVDSRQPNTVNPVFSLSSTYHLFEATTLTLTVDSAVTPSYFQNQIMESTGFTAGIHQRLLEKLFLDLSGGFMRTSYATTTAGVAVNRQDENDHINVRLTCPFLTHGTAAIFYDWTDHPSNEQGFQYTSNQGGFELSWRY